MAACEQVRRIGFVLGDPRLPFPAPAARTGGRWQSPDGPPVLHVAETPDGAWAELLRHEEITDPADLAGIRRRLWAVELDPDHERPGTPEGVGHREVTGDEWSYPACRRAARRAWDAGVTVLQARSAALRPMPSGGTAGYGIVWVLAGERDLRAWATSDAGGPTAAVLRRVAPLGAAGGRPHDGPERRRRERRQTIDLVRVDRGLPERRAGFLGDRRGTGGDAQPPPPPGPPTRPTQPQDEHPT